MAQYSVRRGVGIIVMHNPPVNGLSLAVRDGILRALESADKDKCQSVVLLGSGRTFPAGADISEFARGTFASPPDLNTVLKFLDSYNKPLVACIHGTALGGGLETALACHWRIGASSAKVGLPEVHLGILPGAGGTQRLPRIVGFQRAVEIITSGRMIKAQEALKLGILDYIFETTKAPVSDDILANAVDFALSERVLSAKLDQRRVSVRAVAPVSEEEYNKCLSDVRKASRGFVAPETIVKAIRASYEAPDFSAGMQSERDLFQGLMAGNQAKALQYFFFAERRVGKVPGIPDDVKLKPVKSVGVIGGGTMGAGITMSFIESNIPVTLVETSAELATAAVSRIEKTYKLSSAYKKGSLTDEAVALNVSKITPATDYSSLSGTDLVIEAAFENMPLKKQIFAELNKKCKPGAILASNTSYLSIDEIASCTDRAKDVIGMRE
jgi:3-hydroxyacyl-CoA dehydrogenase